MPLPKDGTEAPLLLRLALPKKSNVNEELRKKGVHVGGYRTSKFFLKQTAGGHLHLHQGQIEVHQHLWHPQSQIQWREKRNC